MMCPPEYDEDEIAREEANYQTPTAKERRAFVRDRVALEPEESLLSIGCGPRFEPAEFAASLPAKRFLGVDANPLMLSRARERCPEDVSLLRGDAMDLPVTESAFDAAVSVQVYEYVDDLESALTELHRVLNAEGRAIVYATDWETLVWNAEDRERANQVLDAWTDHCAHPRLGSKLRSVLPSTDLTIVGVDPYPILQTKLGQNSYAHYLLESIREFVTPKLDAETARSWANDLRTLDRQDETFFFLCQFCYLVKPA